MADSYHAYHLSILYPPHVGTCEEWRENVMLLRYLHKMLFEQKRMVQSSLCHFLGTGGAGAGAGAGSD